MKMKTMLFHTFLALILVTTVLTEGTEEELGNNPNVTIKVSTSVSYSESTSQHDVDSKDHPQTSLDFETSHKRPEIETSFQTSHKIQNERPIIKVSSSDGIAEERKMRSNEDLMQMQKTELLLPSKEKPELNPVLSMLINEDIMKNIEARMIVEKERQEKVAELKKTITKPKVEEPAPVSESDEDDITTMPTVILTTETPSKKITRDDDDEVVVDDEDNEKHNSGLVDQSTNLEVAGSEQNKKSRIQIKKGPNGQDYEYEYVYYYYDEDENENKTDTKLPKKESKDKKTDLDTKKETNNKNKKEKAEKRTAPVDDEPQSEASTTRGKSRYTNIDRSKANNANENTDNVGTSKQVKSGRSSIPVTEDVDEERLPSITRFPPRNNKNIDLASTEATVVINGEKPKKKHHIKRPSLVDSDTFNTDDKQAKGNRNAETQQQAENKVEQQKPVESSETAKQPNLKSSAVLDSVDNDIENTTPFMEKVAFDLYAILANENLNLDAATDTSLTDDTTISADADGAATENDDESATTVAIPSTTTTSTTTTTEAPTTTTTTTTSTTSAPLPGGKRGLSSAGRNRFRLKNGASTTTTSTTEAPAEQTETKSFKGTKNRFQRPSFGSRASRPQFSTTTPPKEEEVVKEEAQKPAQSTPLRGRTRNRFSLRGSSTSTTEKNIESAADDSPPASTTARSLRARPTLNLRGRTRSTTTQAPAPSEESADNSEKEPEDAPKEKPAPTKSRFSLNRPGGPNRLAPRNRVNPLQKSTTPAPSSDSENKTEDETTPSTLNKLKTRPKIQVQSKTESKSKLAPINRKVNPLLARRKLQLGPSTTEPPVSDEEHEDLEADTNEKNEKKAEETPRETSNNGDNKDDTTVENVIEVSSEPPRGLGLLGQRRKLPLRKPGTIL